MNITLTTEKPFNGLVSAPTLGDLQDKKITHWSSYVEMAGLLGGVIMLIAGLVLANPALIVPGLFFALTNGIGTYYTHTFSQYSQLESYVTLFKERNNELEAQIKKDRANNQALSDLNKAFEEKEKAWIKKEKDLQEAWKDRSKALEKDISDLKDTAARLEKERVLAVSALDKRVQDLQKENDTLTKTSLAAQNQLDEIQKTVIKITEENNQLTAQVTTFKAAVLTFETKNGELNAINDTLKKQISQLSEACKKPNFDPAHLSSTADKLQKTADQLDKLNKNNDAKLNNLEDLAQKIEADL